jgi:proton-translocating NADH-quinone oxidoreductase chain N
LISSPLIYLNGRVTRRASGDRSWTAARWAALAACLLGWIPFVMAYQGLQAGQTLTLSFGMVTLKIDGLSLLLAGVVLFLTTFVVLFSGPYLDGEDGDEKYYALLLAMSAAMIGLGCANDLFNLWIWFEMMAIASFMLVAFHRSQAGALEAGVKYLVQSAIGSALVLFGIALVFAQAGTLNLDQIRAWAQTTLAAPGNPATPFMAAAGALFLIGFGVKAALVPMHTWLPDAHSQAPSGISAMLSGVVIEAGLVALLRALGALFTLDWGMLLLGFGALNMLVGNLMALRQSQVKRLLAFSSLSHVGYMLVGLGVGVGFSSAAGAEGGFFHLINHGMMKGLAFLAAGTLLYALYIANGKHDSLTIKDLNGAARKYPLVALTLSVALLGLGGLPPLSGFMSKWQIFAAGFQTQDPWVIALVIFAALNSVLSLGYYAPLISAMYRSKPSEAVEGGARVPFLMHAPLVLLAVGVVVLGLWPSLASSFTIPAGKALLAAFGA